MSCVTLVKAALARFLFGCHSLVTVWRVVTQEEDSYWKIAIGIVFLFLEGLHSLCYRKGEELKWFCPSVLIYLITLVPAIWILELKTKRKENLCMYMELIQERMNSKKTEDQIRTSMLMEVMQVKHDDLIVAKEACKTILSDSTHKLALSNEEGLKNILDINLNIALKPEQWTRILEQVALVVLILGRWLLPKGSLSRDQFSQLMLVYIGMAADIVEIFEAFRETKVILEPSLTYAILGVWTLSLIQFCLILSGGHRGRKYRMTYNSNQRQDEENGPSRSRRESDTSSLTLNSTEEKKKRIQMDMLAIMASLLLQDGPFICLRMTLIFKFKVISHMNIFFTCKNTLVILLQVYRLLILFLERRPQYRRHSRIFSLMPSIRDSENDDNSEQESSTRNEEEYLDKRTTNHPNTRKIRSSVQISKKINKGPRQLLKRIATTSEELPLSSASEIEEIASINTSILEPKYSRESPERNELVSTQSRTGVCQKTKNKITYI